MSNCKLNFAALEECFQTLGHLFIDFTRMVAETGYAEKRGGYGDVQVSTLDPETPNSKLVAAKRISLKGADKDPGRLAFVRQRLARELKVWAGLHHPHILPLFGYYLDEGCRIAILISEYMIYGDIRNYIDQTTPSWAPRLNLVRDLTDGLAYLHGQEPPVRHGDLKMGNILVNAEERAVLADFGLSKALEERPTGLTTSEGLKGTLRYYSPELLTETDPAQNLSSDIWAWACLVLEAGVLTDKVPYGEKVHEHHVFVALVTNELPSDVETLPIPAPAIKRLLLHSWSLQPDKRPLAKDCLHILNSETSYAELNDVTDSSEPQCITINPSSQPSFQSPRGARQGAQSSTTSRSANARPSRSTKANPSRPSPSSVTGRVRKKPNLGLMVVNPDNSSDDDAVPIQRNIPQTTAQLIPMPLPVAGVSQESKNIPQSQQAVNLGLAPTLIKPDRREPVDKLIIMVTADAENHTIVDLTGAKDAAFIRERMFSQLRIPDDDHKNHQIYRTELGEAALGDPITDDQLMIYCEALGDAKGTLKFIVQRNPAAPPPQPQFAPLIQATVKPHVQPSPTIPNPTPPLFSPAYDRRRAENAAGGLSSATDRDRDRPPWDMANGDVDGSHRRRHQLPAPIDTSRRRREPSASGSDMPSFSPTSPSGPPSSMTPLVGIPSRRPQPAQLTTVAAAGAYLNPNTPASHRRRESGTAAMEREQAFEAAERYREAPNKEFDSQYNKARAERDKQNKRQHQHGSEGCAPSGRRANRSESVDSSAPHGWVMVNEVFLTPTSATGPERFQSMAQRTPSYGRPGATGAVNEWAGSPPSDGPQFSPASATTPSRTPSYGRPGATGAVNEWAGSPPSDGPQFSPASATTPSASRPYPHATNTSYTATTHTLQRSQAVKYPHSRRGSVTPAMKRDRTKHRGHAVLPRGSSDPQMRQIERQQQLAASTIEQSTTNVVSVLETRRPPLRVVDPPVEPTTPFASPCSEMPPTMGMQIPKVVITLSSPIDPPSATIGVQLYDNPGPIIATSATSSTEFTDDCSEGTLRPGDRERLLWMADCYNDDDVSGTETLKPRTTQLSFRQATAAVITAKAKSPSIRSARAEPIRREVPSQSNRDVDAQPEGEDRGGCDSDSNEDDGCFSNTSSAPSASATPPEVKTSGLEDEGNFGIRLLGRTRGPNLTPTILPLVDNQDSPSTAVTYPPISRENSLSLSPGSDSTPTRGVMNSFPSSPRGTRASSPIQDDVEDHLQDFLSEFFSERGGQLPEGENI